MSAIADLIWPLLVVGVVAFAYRHRKSVGPALREILRERNVSAELPGGFKIDVGGQPIAAQQVVDDQREQTEKLRRDVSALAAQVAELTAAQGMRAGLPAAQPAPEADRGDALGALTRRILWVDDQPANNAYEIAALKDRGVEVQLATSTDEALRLLADDPSYDALVTDLGREEHGASRPTAGLTLLRELRDRKLDIPAVVYASAGGVRRHGARAIELGAMGATADPSELLELLAVNYGPQFAVRFERQVRGVLERSAWEFDEQAPDAGVDFLARRDGQQVGVEAKAWVGEPPRRRVESTLAQLARTSLNVPIWIVTPSKLAWPPDLGPPDNVELLSLGELHERLGST
jgi:CheY-like chemotaxis protein